MHGDRADRRVLVSGRDSCRPFSAICCRRPAPATEAPRRSRAPSSTPRRAASTRMACGWFPGTCRCSRAAGSTARPNVTFTQKAAAVGHVDADDGFGHLASFRAIEEGIAMARSQRRRGDHRRPFDPSRRDRRLRAGGGAGRLCRHRHDPCRPCGGAVRRHDAVLRHQPDQLRGSGARRGADAARHGDELDPLQPHFPAPRHRHAAATGGRGHQGRHADGRSVRGRPPCCRSAAPASATRAPGSPRWSTSCARLSPAWATARRSIRWPAATTASPFRSAISS